MFDIVPLLAGQLPALNILLDARFGPARHNRTAYRLRDGSVLRADGSFAAMDGDRLVGAVQCWPIRLRTVGGARLPLVLLGPVAVAASHERQGLGSRLVRASLAALDAADSPPVLLIGDAPFYGRFGFSAAATAHWQLPGPIERSRLLLRGPSTGLPHTAWLEADTAAPPGGDTAQACQVA